MKKYWIALSLLALAIIAVWNKNAASDFMHHRITSMTSPAKAE